MTGRNIAVSQRITYTPSLFTCFLWWLATAEKELLIDAVIDRNRYRIIGMSVLGTWLFACLSWTYFFGTICTSIYLSVFLGLFMGFIILTIDRALIKGINRFNKRKFIPLLFRALLALTIGSFMAQPVVLFMFDKEIKLQVSLDNEKRKMTNRTGVEQLFKNQKTELLLHRQELKSELILKNETVEKARQNYLAETDGSGGSGKIGLKDIAMAKRSEYEKLDEEYKKMQQQVQPKLDNMELALNDIDNKIMKEQSDFETYLNDGFLTRAEALTNLLQSNRALEYRYYLIVFILILIELMPVIAKTLFPSGSYDEKVMLREKMEIALAQSNMEKEQQLKELYNQEAYSNDADVINSFFVLTKNERTDKIRSLSKTWKDDNLQSFDGLWEKIKKDILTKQEN